MKISDEDMKRCSKPLLYVVKNSLTPIPNAKVCIVQAQDLVPEIHQALLLAVFWELVNQKKIQVEQGRVSIPKPKSVEPNLKERRTSTMAKKLTQEEVVVDFFQNAEIGKVETVANITKSIIKRRLAAETKKPAIVKKAAKNTPAAPAAAAAAATTEAAA